MQWLSLYSCLLFPTTLGQTSRGRELSSGQDKIDHLVKEGLCSVWVEREEIRLSWDSYICLLQGTWRHLEVASPNNRTFRLCAARCFPGFGASSHQNQTERGLCCMLRCHLAVARVLQSAGGPSVLYHPHWHQSISHFRMEARAQKNTCGTICLKYLIFLFNVIFWVSLKTTKSHLFN